MQSVAIIGAGPAGCVAGILLSRAGIKVTLIEQHRFPRDKVCGECLSAVGIEVLGRLGLNGQVMRLGATRLNRAMLFAPDGTGAELRLPREMWGISRKRLDQCLLEAAKSSGVAVHQPARLEGSSLIRDLGTNELTPLVGDVILRADGKSDASGHDLGLKAHFEQVRAPADAIELFGVRGHYGGIAPIEGGRWNIAFSVPRARVREYPRDLDALWNAILDENVALKRQMDRATRVSDWLVSPLPRSSVQRDWPAGTIPIGNSAAAIEPIGGEGMGLAMRSAEMAAECLIEAFRRGVKPDVVKLRWDYVRLWRVRGLVCRATARVVSSPWLCGMLLPFVDSDDNLTDLALRALGKA